MTPLGMHIENPQGAIDYIVAEDRYLLGGSVRINGNRLTMTRIMETRIDRRAAPYEKAINPIPIVVEWVEDLLQGAVAQVHADRDW